MDFINLRKPLTAPRDLLHDLGVIVRRESRSHDAPEPTCSAGSATSTREATRSNKRSGHRNYAGTSPITFASGKKRSVTARHVRNKHLNGNIEMWAFSSLNNSQGCREFYDHRRAAGGLHHQALRALGNRLVGYLHGCLRTRSNYDETIAWAHRQQNTAT